MSAKPQRSPSLPPSPGSVQPPRAVPVLPGSPVRARRALGWRCGRTLPGVSSTWTDGQVDTWPHSPASSAASRTEARAGLEGLWLGVMVGQGCGPPPATPSYSLTLGGRWSCPMPGLSIPLPPSSSVATRSWGLNHTPGGCGSDWLGVPWTRDSTIQPWEGHAHHPPCPPVAPAEQDVASVPKPRGEARSWGPKKGREKQGAAAEPCALPRPVSSHARDSALRGHWDRSGDGCGGHTGGAPAIE